MPAPERIDATLWLRHAWRNRLHTLVLLLTMGGFLALLGWLLWGAGGLLVLVTMGAVGMLFNPSVSPRLVMRLYGARSMSPYEAPALWELISGLAQRAGLAVRPDLYYVPSSMLNAFAMGSRHQAAIAVTDGLLRRLERRELAGVLAHEVSHVRNNDMWVMGLADILSRATSLLSLMGQFLLLLNLPLILFTEVTIDWLAILLLIFAPNLSALAQLALARTREYDADLDAARLTGDPDGLARALAKIEQVQGGWLERVFMPGRRIPEPSMLRTHPDTRKRIARLMELKPRLAGVPRSPYPGDGMDIAAALGRPVARLPVWHITGLWH